MYNCLHYVKCLFLKYEAGVAIFFGNFTINIWCHSLQAGSFTELLAGFRASFESCA